MGLMLVLFVLTTRFTRDACATRKDVWDGIELEGIPEDTEYIAPFKVVGDNLIIHRFHGDHALRLQEENTLHSEHARSSWIRSDLQLRHLMSLHSS
ncbi:unnamed protein product [Microthlaspi erraticum]|uniref:Hexosyltransferase n=1 Tax=Microthlaspi erraticum TaxID=1685480 RepID=A0A6D2KDM4_9BRAS|nr:unnamed protein product [Microthlaspi erraticum]